MRTERVRRSEFARVTRPPEHTVTAVEGIVIEPERPEDGHAIEVVVRRAFAHHPEVADMVAAIRRSPRYRPELALVAREGEDIVGFVMLSGTDLIRPSGERCEVLTLPPLAVVPECQRRGIGGALVRAGLHAAGRLGEPLVVLEGSPVYYGRLGFRFAGDYGISMDLPEWAPREAAQVYVLPTHCPGLRGRIEYPPAIAEVSD
jgi:putative acetyltransferase